jgi:DNA (cytosine-5)-methyltransferase 1
VTPEQAAAARRVIDAAKRIERAAQYGVYHLAGHAEYDRRARRPAATEGSVKPRLLDLFCGAGGAGMGYHQAGFDVVGVDIRPQPNYPFEFHQADAMTWPLDGFDAVHASPPCQDHSTLRTTGPVHDTGWMLQATVERLKASALPYAIENVPGARDEMPDAYVLCGKAFGLRPLKRHRLFLTSVPMLVPPCVCHPSQVTVGVYGDLAQKDRAASSLKDGRHTAGVKAGVHTARRLLDCPWMTPKELSQAIPPAYTRFIGEQLMDHLKAVAA